MKNAVISGTGSYSPERQITNTELEKQLDTTDEWIFSRTGISSRSIAQEHETTSFMAAQAAQRALTASGLDVEEIDLIIVATCTPDYFFPSVACHVQAALKIKRPIPAFDVLLHAVVLYMLWILQGNTSEVGRQTCVGDWQ